MRRGWFVFGRITLVLVELQEFKNEICDQVMDDRNLKIPTP
jgi:hypothetical protein